MLTPEQLKEIASLDTEDQQNAVLADMTKQILDPVEERKQDGLMEAKEVLKEQKDSDRWKLMAELDNEIGQLDAASVQHDWPRCMTLCASIHSIVDKLDCL